MTLHSSVPIVLTSAYALTMDEDWSVDYYERTFERSLRALGEYEQAVLIAAVENVLAKYGIDICQGEW